MFAHSAWYLKISLKATAAPCLSSHRLLDNDAKNSHVLVNGHDRLRFLDSLRPLLVFVSPSLCFLCCSFTSLLPPFVCFFFFFFPISPASFSSSSRCHRRRFDVSTVFPARGNLYFSFQFVYLSREHPLRSQLLLVEAIFRVAVNSCIMLPSLQRIRNRAAAPSSFFPHLPFLFLIPSTFSSSSSSPTRSLRNHLPDRLAVQCLREKRASFQVHLGLSNLSSSSRPSVDHSSLRKTTRQSFSIRIERQNLQFKSKTSRWTSSRSFLLRALLPSSPPELKSLHRNLNQSKSTPSSISHASRIETDFTPRDRPSLSRRDSRVPLLRPDTRALDAGRSAAST